MISIFIPAYNEKNILEKRAANTILEIAKKNDTLVELIIGMMVQLIVLFL